MRLAITILLAGCLHPSVTDDIDPTDSTDNPDPVHPTTPPAPVASGTYTVHSQIDLTIEALLPEPAAQLVVTLRDFSTAPAHTLITLADDAGVPAVSELRAVLPDVLENRLEGWIDGEIAKLELAGVPITQLAGEAAAVAETTLTRGALGSELDVTGATATHRLTMLDFTPAGLDVQLALDTLPSDVVAATTTASSEQGALSLGDHRFSLAYGEYAWRAVDAVCVAAHGAGIRATLGAAIDCPTLGSKIASKCVLGLCVGHAAQLTELCERGLDEVVARASAKVSALRFDVLHLAAGTAAIASGGARLEQGVWNAEINAGVGLRHVPATFAATR